MIRTIVILIFFAIAALPVSAGETAAPAAREVGWREDFSRGMQKNVPTGWKMEGTKFFVTDTEFRVENDPEAGPDGKKLVIDAKQATGTIVTMPLVDVEKYPILRWKWRVRKLSPGADGRDEDRDDQAAGIYFGAGGVLSRKSVGYRWETETPIGTTGRTSYGAGVISVFYECLRNETTPLDTWFEEEVDAKAAFEKIYGYVPGPDEYVVSVNANSQYTESHSIAEIAYIELVSRPEAEKDQLTAQAANQKKGE